jgi:hypothetical protein
MITLPSKSEHIVLAARARRLMREATNEIARAVHHRIARVHEAKVGTRATA